MLNRDQSREGLANHVTDHHPETPTRMAQHTVVGMVMVMEAVMETVMEGAMVIRAKDATIILRCLSLVPLRAVLF